MYRRRERDFISLFTWRGHFVWKISWRHTKSNKKQTFQLQHSLLVLRPQVMADSGMALRMPFQNAQQHTISEHPNYHSFKNIWQKNRSAKPLFKAFQNVYAVGGSGMAILSVFQNALKLMFQECCSKKGWKQKVPECQSADASRMRWNLVIWNIGFLGIPEWLKNVIFRAFCVLKSSFFCHSGMAN